MSEQTKRFMRHELDRLLAQRARYVQAERASRDVGQKVQHTRQRLRLDEEILGRREALHALENHGRRTRPLPADEGLHRPRLAATGSPSPARPKDRSLVPLALGVCVATFGLGFVLVGSGMNAEREAKARPGVERLRYRPLGPATSVRVPQTRDEPVMAATARARKTR